MFTDNRIVTVAKLWKTDDIPSMDWSERPLDQNSIEFVLKILGSDVACHLFMLGSVYFVLLAEIYFSQYVF